MEYIMDRWSHEGKTVRSELERSRGELSNWSLAWAISASVDSAKAKDYMPGVAILGDLLAQLHGIPRRESDVILLTRPDVVYSHAVDVPRRRPYEQETLGHMGPFVPVSRGAPSEKHGKRWKTMENGLQG